MEIPDEPIAQIKAGFCGFKHNNTNGTKTKLDLTRLSYYPCYFADLGVLSCRQPQSTYSQSSRLCQKEFIFKRSAVQRIVLPPITHP